jgi:putative ABC transport system permease protein
MLSNYLKVAIRNLLRHKTFSFINIFGLSIGMSVCLLVILMLADQYTYDKFHTKKDSIFRILSGTAHSSIPVASTPPELAANLRENYADIAHATNLVMGVGGEATWKQTTAEMRGFFADEYFFQVFDFELEEGSKEHALTSPRTLVITRQLSRNLFGEEDPLGKTVEFTDRGLHYLRSGKDRPPVSWGTFTITGVIADRNYKSHLNFDVLMSSSTKKLLAAENKFSVDASAWDKAFTYVLLRNGKNRDNLAASLNDLFNRSYAHFENLKGFSLAAQPLTSITPGIMVSQPPSFQLPLEAYYFLGFIAMAIMLSACLNYTNLSTARALTRAKEIGVRKVTGAQRKDLVFQFLSESVVTSLVALLLAMALLVFIKPAFTGLWLNQYLNFDLQTNSSVYFVFAALALVLGIIAGFYPALRLSAFHPVKAITKPDHIPAGKLGMRKILNASQFVISLFFIITSIVIHTQFRYFINFEYGFTPKGIVNVELQGNTSENIANAFSSVAAVSLISASEYVPATGRTSGMDVDKPGSQETINFRVLSATGDFIDNLGLKLIAGRNSVFESDSSHHIIVNENAVAALGYDSPDQIIGEGLIQSWNKEPLEVVGVVKNFWLSLPIAGDTPEPAFIHRQGGKFSYANVRIVSSDVPGTLAMLEKQWKTADPVHPFRFRFYEEELASTHGGIFDVVTIVGFLAFIAITIACLGMLGMATYTAERKKKEVGIRKVLGAESLQLAFLLSKDYLKILVIAVCVGAPATHLINNAWLQIFPNRAEFGFSTIFLGAAILLVSGLVTIGSQTIIVSKANPVESLKME